MTILSIAPGTSRLTLLPLRLYRFDVAAPRHAGSDDGVDDDVVGSLRDFARHVRAVPVVDGYVIAIPTFSTSGGSIQGSAPNMDEAIVASTNAYGQIRTAIPPYFNAEGEIVFRSGGSYEIFWTYSRTVFDRAMTDLNTEGPTDRVLNRYQFRTYVLEPEDLFRGDVQFPLLRPNERSLELFALYRALAAPPMGYVRVDASGERHRIDLYHHAMAIVDRTGPLLALYAAEMAQLCAAAILSDTMQDQSRLHHVEQMIAVEEAGRWPPDVEPTLAGFDRTRARILQAYREYALACAREPALPPRLYVDSLRVNQNSTLPWLAAAQRILDDHRIEHPYFAEQTRVNDDMARNNTSLDDPYASAFEFYFDYYRLALRERRHGYLRALATATRAQDAELREVQRWISDLTERRLRHPDFLLDLDWHFPEERAPRIRLMDRYFTLCSGVGFRFWEDMTTAVDANAHVRPSVVWFAAGTTGGVAEVMGGLWERHLKRYSLTGDQVAAFLESQLATHAAATGTRRLPLPGGQVTLVVDFERSIIRVEGASLYGSGLSEFRFTREVAPHTAGSAATRASGARTVTSPRLPEQRFTYDVPVGLEETHRVPIAIQTLSQTLNIALAIDKLRDELQRRDISTWITLGTNTLQLAENAGSILGALYRTSRSAWLHRLVSATSAAGTVATFVDAGMMLQEGATILCSPNGGLSVALQRHDTTEAWLMGARGALLVAGGGASLAAETYALIGGAAAAAAAGETVAVAGTAAFAAAAVPVGVVVGAVGLLVLAVDVALWARDGGTSHLADFDTAFLRAKRHEFYRGQVVTSDDAPVHPRTAGRLRTLHHALRALGG